MDAGLATVAAAGIAAVGVLLQQVVASRKEQRQDHGVVQQKLDNLNHSVNRVEKKMDKVEEKIDEHITDHAKGVV